MADQDELLAFRLERDGRAVLPVLEQSDAADCRRGEDGEAASVFTLGLVVERDVAAHDGEVERAAGFGHAGDAADELAHDLGPLRVAEVEAVGDRQRLRADRAKVPIGFRGGLLAALGWGRRAIAWGPGRGDRQRRV